MRGLRRAAIVRRDGSSPPTRSLQAGVSAFKHVVSHRQLMRQGMALALKRVFLPALDIGGHPSGRHSDISKI